MPIAQEFDPSTKRASSTFAVGYVTKLQLTNFFVFSDFEPLLRFATVG